MGPSSLQQDSNYFLALNNIDVKHLKSSPYHPATNGLVERFIQTLKQALRILKRDGHTAAQPGQLLTELPKRMTFYHRRHSGNIDDGEGSTMQTHSLEARLEVLPDSSDTEPGDMPGKLTSVNSTSPLAPPSPQEPFGQQTIITRYGRTIKKPTHYLDTSV